MRVLILNWKDVRNPDVGGAEIILYELAKRMVQAGHSVTWFCRGFRGGEREDIIDGIHVIRRGNRFTVYWEAYRYYRSLSVKPDKVLDCINTICWQTPLYVPKNKRVAYVNQLAKEVLYYELPPILSHLAYILEPLEYRPYLDTKFLCYSDSVKKDISSFGIPTDNIQTFPIGIDNIRYTQGKKSHDPLFLFVARLTRMKRPDLCIESMRLVRKQYPKAKLAVVGYGPMERKITEMIGEYGLAGNVFVVNKDHLYFERHPKDQKVRLMQEAWALLLPSVKEGWGMVVTESAACGTPTIATRVTGLEDSVKNGKTGILISRNPSAGELARAMERILRHATLRKRLSDNAQAQSANFTWQESYRQFMANISR